MSQLGHQVNPIKPWLHACAVLGLAATLNAAPADFEDAPPIVVGEPLADILQNYREHGYPLTWSSGLITPGLEATVRPAAEDPLEALGEVLAPHSLLLRRMEGILLVVRAGGEIPQRQTGGRILVIVRDERARLPEAPVTVRITPPAGASRELGQGVVEFQDVPPGKYGVFIEGMAFETASRQVQVDGARLATVQVRLKARPAALDDLTVTTSRYVLLDNSRFFIDQRALQSLPDIGDDPIRAAHRLPGAAAGGWSSPAHFRGGEQGETAIYLNGLRLLDPFHVRDFHNVFSSLDARSISGVQAYTGGFPVLYGDRMSGVLLLESQRPDQPRHYEFGLSVFNTSMLASGFSRDGDRDWLLSGRRSNLGHVLDEKEHGKPSYNDVFAQLGIEWSGRTRVSLNALRARDHNLVITEDKPEEEERATSDTLNQSLWLQFRTHWSDRLFSETVASWRSLSNERDGMLNDPEQLVGRVIDDRDVEIHALTQDWEFEANPRHLLRWGWAYGHESADYRYSSRARYSGFYLAYPGVPEHLARDIEAHPSGDSWAAYLTDRIRITPRTALEAGLRWDRQTWAGEAGGNQWSPRLSLLHEATGNVELRLAWGVYHQSQGIQNLQVEDGVDRFYPAQEARHLILGARIRFGEHKSLRLEAYEKHYGDLRPRYENLLDPLPLVPELEPDRIRVAPRSARARGIEVTFEHDGGLDLDWWATYSWSRAEDRIGESYQPRNWDQRHSFQAGVAWAPGNWDLGIAARLNTPWPTTPAYLVGEDEDSARLVYGPRNSDRLNTFFNLDLRVARTWPMVRGRLTAFFEVVNLTNRKNECCADYDAEFGEGDDSEPTLERSVDHWLGITPAVGIVWEF